MTVLSTEATPTSPTQSRDAGNRPMLRRRGPLEAALAPTDHELTVIIPAYNEQSRLPRSLATLAEFLDASWRQGMRGADRDARGDRPGRRVYGRRLAL